MKITITKTENGSYQIVDPETGAVYSNRDRERVKKIFVNRYVRFEDEDISPAEAARLLFETMSMGMTLGEIVYKMSWHEAPDYEPNSFQYLSNRDFTELMRKACSTELPNAEPKPNNSPTDLFEVMKNTTLVLPKNFEIVAHVPQTTQGNKAYWILQDGATQYTIIQAWKGGAGQWHFAEHRTHDVDDLKDHAPVNDSGVYVKLNLEEQLKKNSQIGTYNFREYIL